MVQERCFWYRNDGTPYKHIDGTQGCDRPRCIYAHPAIPREWNSAIPASSRPSRRLLAVDECTRSRSRSPRRLHDRPPRVRSSSRTRSSYSPRRRGRSPSRERRRKSGGRAHASSPASSSPQASRRSRSRERRRDRHSADPSNRHLHRLPFHRSYGSYRRRDSPSHDDGSVRGRSLSPLHHPTRLSRGAELAQDVQTLHDQGSHKASRDPAPARSIPTGPRKRTVVALPTSVPRGNLINPPANASAAHRKSPFMVSIAAGINEEAKGPAEDEVNLPEEPPDVVKAVAESEPLEVTLVASLLPANSAPAPPSIPPPPLPPPVCETSMRAFIPPPLPPPIFVSPSLVAQSNEDSMPYCKDELTLEEKRNAWGERIDLLASASMLRTEYRLLEDEIQGHSRVVASPAFMVLPPSERTAFEGKVSEAKARQDTKAEELKDVLFRLAESNYWPFNILPKPKAESPGVTPDLMAQFSDLKDAVGQLHGLLYAVIARVDVSAAVAVKEEKSVKDGMSGKRRRREEDADPLDLLPAASSNVAQRKELEELQSRLSSFEDRLSNIENAFVLHEDDVRDEIHVLLEERTDEESKSDSKLQALEEDWNATGETVKELLREMRELKLRTETVNKENAHLKLEVEVLTQHIEELNIRQEAEMDRMHREIIDLREVMHTHLSRAPIPAPALDLDALLTTVRPILIRSIRDELEPMLSELKLAVQDALRAHNKELAEAVVPKLHMAVQAAETIRAWADRIGVAGIADVQAHPQGHRAH